MNTHLFTAEIWVPRPVQEVFAFFADAHNLDRITPPWLHFRTQTPTPIAMRAGTLIEYRLRLRGFPIRWRTRITVWEPPHRFVDEQIQGPYKLWVHEHDFAERDGGTLIRDTVTYAVPGGPLEPLIHSLLVAPDVRKIFEHRKKRIQELFG